MNYRPSDSEGLLKNRHKSIRNDQRRLPLHLGVLDPAHARQAERRDRIDRRALLL